MRNTEKRLLSSKRVKSVRMSISLLCSLPFQSPVTPVFSIMSSFLYMFIFHIVALHPVYHRSTKSHTSLVPSILPSKTVHRRDSLLNTWHNFSLFVGWCPSSFCFHPPCPNPLNWIGVQSNWFSLTSPNSHFKRFQTSNVHFPQRPRFCGIQYRVFSLTPNFISPLSNSPRLLNTSFPMAVWCFTSSWLSPGSTLILIQLCMCSVHEKQQ